MPKGVSAPSGSSYDTRPTGLSAIYHVLSEAGQAQRWERKPGRLPSSPDIQTLVVWQPMNELTDDAWDELLAWVEQGHSLVVATDQWPQMPGPARPVGEGVARSAAAHSLTVGIGDVMVGPRIFGSLDIPMLTHLTRADGAPVLVSQAHGQGRIYWSADVEWLTNGRIAQSDNFALALRLLTPAPGQQTAFDEYMHGFRAADRWWQLLRGPLQFFVIQLTVFLAVLFWAYGMRFGAPRALPVGPPRAAVEYIHSMSQLYRRAKARRIVLEALHRSLLRELGRLLGGIGGMSHAEIARRTAERTGAAPTQVERALAATAPTRTDKPGDEELIDLAQQCEAIQRRVRHAGFRDQRRA